MNLLVATDLFLPGHSGVITAVSKLVEELARQGHHVSVICPESDAAEHWASSPSITLCFVPGARLPFRIEQRIALPPLLPASRRLIERVSASADVAHLHSPYVLGPVIANIARRHCIPIVITNHLHPENVVAAMRVTNEKVSHAISKVIWSRIKRCLLWADVVTSPSEYGAREIRHHCGVAATVLSNGIRVPRLRDSLPRRRVHRSTFMGLAVGRLQAEKRVSEIIHGLAAVRDIGASMKLVIVGDGPDRQQLVRLVSRLQLDRDVIFKGRVSDAVRNDLYRTADVLCVASRVELQSCVALEAMAVGCPVVAARAGAMPETVPDRSAGRLYTPGAIREFRDIICELITDRQQYVRLRSGAHRAADVHDLSNVCKQLEAMYRLAKVRSA